MCEGCPKILQSHQIQANYSRKKIILIAEQSEYDKLIGGDEIIDFDNGIILLISMGFRGSDAYSIELVTVQNYDYAYNRVHIQYKVRCIGNDIATNPFQIIWIESRKDILISEEVVREDCEIN